MINNYQWLSSHIDSGKKKINFNYNICFDSSYRFLNSI